MTTKTHRGSRLLVGAIIIGLIAAGIALLRLWLGNQEAITQVVWAEDGLFPLCIEKAGFFKCLVDPFAGYLLFLPRLIAGIVQLFPESAWPLVTNLLAAGIAGIVAALSFVFMRKFGTSVVVSCFIALLPVLAPIVGLEALNALGSMYMLLIFLCTLVFACPSPGLSRQWTATMLVALLLLLTSLTIPLAGILLGLIAVQSIRRVITFRATLIWAAAIVLGLAAQVVTAATASSPRKLSPSWGSLDSWADGSVHGILTYWPGLTSDNVSVFGMTTVSPAPLTGALVVSGLGILAIVLLVRGGNRLVGIALMLLGGLAYGALPTIIGWANNRYFVLPALLWGAALLIALDPVIRRARIWILALVAVVIGILWWPMFAASPYRSTPAPRWSDEVARIAYKCNMDPSLKERPIFSPFWPPNWGDGLTEPTHPDITCFVGRKWS
ncbi:MAG: hypothetical protein ACKOAF_00065 [Actinomycetes bacterium]